MRRRLIWSALAVILLALVFVLVFGGPSDGPYPFLHGRAPVYERDTDEEIRPDDPLLSFRVYSFEADYDVLFGEARGQVPAEILRQDVLNSAGSPGSYGDWAPVSLRPSVTVYKDVKTMGLDGAYMQYVERGWVTVEVRAERGRKPTVFDRLLSWLGL